MANSLTNEISRVAQMSRWGVVVVSSGALVLMGSHASWAAISSPSPSPSASSTAPTDCPLPRPESTERLGAQIPGDEGESITLEGFAPQSAVELCVYPNAVKSWDGAADDLGVVVLPVDSSIMPALEDPLPEKMYFVVLGEDPIGSRRALTEEVAFGNSSGGDPTQTPTPTASSTDVSFADSGARSIQVTFLLGVCLVACGWWLVRRRRLSA